MRLRRLELKDASFMIEWMHDISVVEKLRTDFGSKTINDCKRFIEDSWKSDFDIHLAIVSDADEYMGTVSLKHIENGSAEFGITVRKSAMSRGYSWFGMKEIIYRAFKEYNLENVYWCVSSDNLRAIKFYEKHNFHEVTDISPKILERYSGMDNLKWYSVSKDMKDLT